MSSKFSRAGNPYKPPAVCHKPPLGPDWPWPPFPDTPFDGYCCYIDHDSPTEGGMEASIAMVPDDVDYTWRGEVEDGIMRIVLYMITTPPAHLVDFQLQWWFNDVLDNLILVNNHLVRSLRPFDSGEVVPEDQPHNGRAAWHIWF